MASVPPTYPPPKWSYISSPGTTEDRYILLFITEQEDTPFSIGSINPFNTHKQKPRIIYLPVEKYIFIIRKNNPTVFPPMSSNSIVPAWRRWDFPSTSSTTNKMADNSHLAVCHSFPNEWGFRGQKIHPGHVHFLFHMDMYLLRQIDQEVSKMGFMW